MSTAAMAIAIGKFLMLSGLGLAAVWDLSKRIVPNTLVLIVGGGGLLLRFAAAERYAVVTSMAAAAVVFILLRLLMSVTTFGGGDAKLIAAVTLGQSLGSAVPMLLSIALAGGVVAAFCLTRQWMKSDDRSHGAATAALRAEMPYVPAVLGGFVLHELWGIVT